MSKAGARRCGAVRSLIAITVASLLAPPVGAVEATWPSQVAARYRMQFNGFDVGTYDFISHFDGKSYSATGKTKISALFGAFTWVGNFAGSGFVESGEPHPSSYEMSYKEGSKLNSVKMGFDGTGVSAIALVPNKPPNPNAIRLKPENLKNVFDPMAATLAISNANASDACNRTIPVFDGRARFDLKLSLKGREAITDERPTGQPKELVVCRVKYIPIAGHKPKDFVNPWIDYDHIEIALRAIPSAGIYVPYRITVPSTLGPAVMDAEAINITAANNTQIALRQ